MLSRGRGDAGQPVWVLACTPGASSEASLRLSQTFELREVFESSWASCPLSLEDQGPHKRLILTDSGGELLSHCLPRAHDLRTRVAIAAGAATALRRLHERDVIHRDVQPSSLITDVATGHVWLRSTGLCSRVPRGRQDDARPAPRGGALAYMSPEQTGRVNRSVDARSDLYSLGVTLYELFAGSPPFRAGDPLAWMHCHVARQPALLEQVVPSFPRVLSELVHKLLAKTPEDRYQTAAGLEADLRHCLRQLETTGEVATFALGRHDASAELRVPERLYGRARELALLQAALASVMATGRTRVVTISGHSGVGKSSLVNELQSTLLARGGSFATGKVDQLKRDIPYASVAEACRTLVRGTLSRSDTEIRECRGKLKQALGGHGQLMVNLIPELEHLVGKQPQVPELPPDEARGRFQHLFQRFIAVFAERERPLTLFFDDLQWLDAATVQLLQALVAGQVEHLLLICAYRDNELRAPHPFLSMLEQLRTGDDPPQELALLPLAPADLTSLVADALRVSSERAAALTRVVHEKTAGNPFFVIQFLSGLVDEHLLVFDAARGWSWQLEQLRSQASTENVLELMLSRFDRLPQDTRYVLQQMACLGRRVTKPRLAAVCERSEEEVDVALREVARGRLVVATDAGYAFSHDRVQEASYALLPESARAATHLKLGRRLAESFGAHDSNEQLFELMHQFDRGASSIVGEHERIAVARLYLEAGTRGRQALAQASARHYFARGRALLGDQAWHAHYELCLALELGHAETTFLAGDPSAATGLLAALALRARCHRDRAAVARLQILIHSALGDQQRAIEVCLTLLQQVGIDCPRKPSRELVQREWDEITRLLGTRSVESLIDLPPMVDPERRATMDTLTAALPVAQFLDEHLNALLVCKMVNMSLAHGNSDGSCFAYVQLGRVLGPYFGDPEAGFRFGRLAYDLLDRPGMGTYRARVASVFAICIHPWTHPVSGSLPLTRRALEIARETGDLTFVAYDWPCVMTLRLARGDELADVEAEATAGLAFTRSAKFEQIAGLLIGQIQLVRALRGRTSGLASFDDDAFDERAFEGALENPMAAGWYWIRKLHGLFLAGDFDAAAVAGERASALLYTSGSFLETVDYAYYQALTLAALHERRPAEQRGALRERLTHHLRQLETWARHCPVNFAPQALLVAAECARLDGHDVQAMQGYEHAIASAREARSLQHEALAHELAARFYRQRKLATSVCAHLTAARACYQRWGATAKVRQLELLLAAFGPASTAQAPRTQDNLDLATVLKSSHAVSHQVGHGRVVRSLMELAVEHAGAQRGLLLLGAEGAMRVEAEASTREAVEVELAPQPAQGALPESMLHYVLRTRETILLDDAAALHDFSTDPYLSLHGVRSVLCLPIQKQAHLVGVLYLENNLAPCVFTQAHVEVLQLLASQAAISLENALLGEKEALLKEVHHRVKNNLQLISSMLNLQAARVSDPKVAELFADCRHRVRSMALVHENLYRAGNFSHIPMQDHVGTLCARLTRAYGTSGRQIELEVAVGELHLEMGRAITCGLIINELVANALKHAFPDGRRGTVRVELHRLASGVHELSVSDDGVGLPTTCPVEEAETLGLQLVRDLAQQLDGDVRWSSAPGRTRFAVSFGGSGRRESARSAQAQRSLP